MQRELFLGCVLLCVLCATHSPIPRKNAREAAKKSGFDSINNPSRWSNLLNVRKLSNLPTSGTASQIPWAGSYWPTFRDSINYRWDSDELSASEKYAQAFSDSGLVDRVSAHYGVDSMNSKRSCSSDFSCESGEVCAMRRNHNTGYCIPTWFGICHAWSPAAITVPEPMHSVLYRGVLFKVNDIKALISLSHDVGSSGAFLALRCDISVEDFNLDSFGRPTNKKTQPQQPNNNNNNNNDKTTKQSPCSDTNAGTFHIAIANMLGLLKRSFVEDRMVDLQVWNQPIRGYSSRVDYLSKEQASALLGPSFNGFSSNATAFANVTTTLLFIGESSQSLDSSFTRCKSNPTCWGSCPEWAAIFGRCSTPSYTCIDFFTHADQYTYILELNSEGEIIGGEWTGDSILNHPDFLWVPAEKPDSVLLPASSGFLYDISAVNFTLDCARDGRIEKGTHLEIYVDYGCESGVLNCNGNCLNFSACNAYDTVSGTGMGATGGPTNECVEAISDGVCQQQFNCPMHGCDGGDCDRCGVDPLRAGAPSMVWVDGVMTCNVTAGQSCYISIFTGVEKIRVVSTSGHPNYYGVALFQGGISYATVRKLSELSANTSCDRIKCKDDWISDGYCDSYNNRIECDFDGGDCCPSSCVSSTSFRCGSAPYACIDPRVTNENCHDDNNYRHSSGMSCAQLAQNAQQCVQAQTMALAQEYARNCPLACGLCSVCGESVCGDCGKCSPKHVMDTVSGCLVCTCDCSPAPSKSSSSSNSPNPLFISGVTVVVVGSVIALVSLYVCKRERRRTAIATAQTLDTELREMNNIRSANPTNANTNTNTNINTTNNHNNQTNVNTGGASSSSPLSSVTSSPSGVDESDNNGARSPESSQQQQSTTATQNAEFSRVVP